MTLTQSEKHLQSVIRARVIARTLSQRQQLQLIAADELHRETIRGKLNGLLESTQMSNFERCGVESCYRTCRSCGTVEKFAYRCSLKWCPSCQWRIATRRAEKISAWTKHVHQPKHVVLTQRNFEILTPSKLRQLQKCIAKIRRNRVFRDVKGGCVSIEITNEGRGWHVHTHWLCDARWINAAELAIAWGKLVGQDFGIVKVLDVRGKSYVGEICKYLAKGSEIASWPAERILEFVTAIRGRRFFFSFGSLFHAGAEIRREIARNAPPPHVCECGSADCYFETEQQAVLNEIRAEQKRRRR